MQIEGSMTERENDFILFQQQHISNSVFHSTSESFESQFDELS